MTLRPDLALLAERIREAERPRLEDLSLEEARASVAPFIRMQGEAPAIARASEHDVPGPAGRLRVRVYRPSDERPLPAIVYFHGGGWVIGDLEVADRLCRALANAAGTVVISVDYRRAPEQPFPAAFDDALAATRWVAEHAGELGADPGRIAVAGDSAGANLAAAVALAARGDRPPLAGQLLVYPVLDADFATASYERNADNPMLPRSTMRWFWACYGKGRGEDDWRALPLRASDLAAAPPAFIATCEYDPLHDDGARYAARLREAGVAVEWRDYAGLLHGVLWTLGATPSAAELFDGLVSAARTLTRGTGAHTISQYRSTIRK